MGTFKTFYANAYFTKPLIRQILAVLQRDMQNSLNVVSGVNSPSATGYLPAPLEWNLGLYPEQQWPSLHIYPTGVKFSRPNTVQSRYAEVSIEVVVGVSNQDRNLLGEAVQDYVRAVDAIIAGLGAQVNSGYLPNFNDFYTALPITLPFPQKTAQSVVNVTTTPMQTGSVEACYVVAHAYGDMNSLTPGFTMRGKCAFKVQMEESN